MKALLLISTILVGVAVVQCAPPDGDREPLDVDRQAIRAVLEGQVAASEDGDAEGYVSFLTERAGETYERGLFVNE